MKKSSEFGKGLCYCLALFLAHAERYEIQKTAFEELKEKTGHDYLLKTHPHLWFNGASDHLYEMQIPETLPKSLQRRLKALKSRAIEFGHGMDMDTAKEYDVNWAIQEAKDLLRAIDKANGIETSKGMWE